MLAVTDDTGRAGSHVFTVWAPACALGPERVNVFGYLDHVIAHRAEGVRIHALRLRHFPQTVDELLHEVLIAVLLNFILF